MAGPRVGVSLVWIPDMAIVANMYFEMKERAEEMEKPMEEATVIIATEIDLNFEVEGRPDKWAPLSEKTLRNRIIETISGSQMGLAGFREGTAEWQTQIWGGLSSGQKILTRSGDLRKASTEPSSWTITTGGTKTVAVLQDITGYGHFHLTGTSQMPQRDYTYISDEAMEEVGDLFTDWIAEPWERATW